MNRSDALESVVLVDDQDNATGTMPKLLAHRAGALHRAFSIFLFDDHGRLLLQRRAMGKYHSGGLWTNTCCSHPRPGETIADAARRRLRDEMGIEASLESAFSFVYRADVGEGFIEHEYDHVLFGRWMGIPLPDPEEVSDWRFVALDDLAMELEAHPERFTAWLSACWPQVLEARARYAQP